MMLKFVSQKFSLKAKDFLIGALMAIGTTTLPAVVALFSTGVFPTLVQFIPIGICAIGTFISYLGHKFFTDDVRAAQKTIATAEVEEINP